MYKRYKNSKLLLLLLLLIIIQPIFCRFSPLYLSVISLFQSHVAWRKFTLTMVNLSLKLMTWDVTINQY